MCQSAIGSSCCTSYLEPSRRGLACCRGSARPLHPNKEQRVTSNGTRCSAMATNSHHGPTAYNRDVAQLEPSAGTFGGLVRGFREQRGWTRQDLAERWGFAREYVSQIELGKRKLYGEES